MGYSLSISDKLVKEILNIIQTEVKINSVYLKNIGTFKIIKRELAEILNQKKNLL